MDSNRRIPTLYLGSLERKETPVCETLCVLRTSSNGSSVGPDGRMCTGRVILQRRLERRSQGDGDTGVPPVVEFVFFTKPKVESIQITS